uniref:Cytochrome P450 n=1 Tax=Trieres chinensis TaxID=1514140 RepID=A0A7S1ZHZ6_TRICV|mmetsp:Transcript_25646/g.52520  ORF Transcript_25646/g.52520 Transcript_25646/m.52520 type:complete len:583 (+) Transcript_25646:28-1776(+)
MISVASGLLLRPGGCPPSSSARGSLLLARAAAVSISKSRCTPAIATAVPVPSSTAVRWHSTVEEAAPSLASSPGAASAVAPKLVKVPSLPLLGSSIPAHTGAPPHAQSQIFEYWPEMRRRFGDFYSMGMPGLGVGTHGTVHVLTCPHEMMKVIRHEGKFPSGIIQSQWALIKYLKEDDSLLVQGEDNGFFGRGAEWKRLRTFFQTDMLSPQAAAGYLPGVIKAAELASRGAPLCVNDLNQFLENSAFDMFCTVMLGELTDVANPETPSDPLNLEFCRSACRGLSLNNRLNIDPYQVMMGKLGIKTELYNEVVKENRKTFKIAHDKIRCFVERGKKGDLNEFENQSYAAHAMRRQAEEGSNISMEEMLTLTAVGLTAAVDTTSGMIAWGILHLALNPEVQERLHLELTNAIKNVGRDGRLSASVFKRSVTPYLYSFLRESHRLTPNAPVNIFKMVSKDIDIHGLSVPSGAMFLFDSFSLGKDPIFVDDPEEFKPERWSPKAVQERKGTPREVLDHAFLKEPFSQGARRCPGSRVASNETLALLAQLVLDYKISVPNVDSLKDVPYDLRGTICPTLPELEFVAR